MLTRFWLLIFVVTMMVFKNVFCFRQIYAELVKALGFERPRFKSKFWSSCCCWQSRSLFHLLFVLCELKCDGKHGWLSQLQRPLCLEYLIIFTRLYP